MRAARVAAFAYHDVTDDRSTSGFQRATAWAYKVPRRDFDLHLDAFAAVVPHPCVVHDVDWGEAEPRVMLTFDDGGASALYAGEALRRHDWRGHFFIVTSLIGRRTFLDAAGVRTLRAQGHVVGSHSHTHPDIFRDLSPRAMAEEWRASRDRLADLLGEPCVTASVPGGDVSPAVFQSAAEAGFLYLFTSEPDPRPTVMAGCRILGRVVVKARTSPHRIERLVRLKGWRHAWVARRLREAAATTLPTLYRYYVAVRTGSHES
jgi:peptidoglycan/xylan/chitin deacetylase (PgdA/CDA1 family)